MHQDSSIANAFLLSLPWNICKNVSWLSSLIIFQGRKEKNNPFSLYYKLRHSLAIVTDFRNGFQLLNMCFCHFVIRVSPRILFGSHCRNHLQAAFSCFPCVLGFVRIANLRHLVWGKNSYINLQAKDCFELTLHQDLKESVILLGERGARPSKVLCERIGREEGVPLGNGSRIHWHHHTRLGKLFFLL